MKCYLISKRNTSFAISSGIRINVFVLFWEGNSPERTLFRGERRRSNSKGANSNHFLWTMKHLKQ